jgi:CRP/FNR family transcriptional regulator, cyclic AMP receptor protein
MWSGFDRKRGNYPCNKHKVPPKKRRKKIVMQTNVSILEAQPFFKGMTTQQLELLAEDSLPAAFRADEQILKEGGTANRFYLIVEGQVEVEAPVLDGEAVPIQTLGPGDLLGWSWLFPPHYWQFAARAATSTKAFCFYGTHLRKVCETNHDLGYELMKRISQVVIKRLQAARRKLVEHNNNLLPLK